MELKENEQEKEEQPKAPDEDYFKQYQTAMQEKMHQFQKDMKEQLEDQQLKNKKNVGQL